MPRGRPKGSKSRTLARSTKGIRNAARKRRPCTVCQCSERARIDFLIAKGEALQPLSRKFHLSPSALYRHSINHISEEYRNVVTASPLGSLESLQKLACESGASVVDNLQAIYAGLSNRWLLAFESGDDTRLAVLTGKMHQNLEIRARISKELLPNGSSFTQINNNFLLKDAGELLKILADEPSARAKIVAYYNEKPMRQIEHEAAD
jgi:hypothetical protein